MISLESVELLLNCEPLAAIPAECFLKDIRRRVFSMSVFIIADQLAKTILHFFSPHWLRPVGLLAPGAMQKQQRWWVGRGSTVTDGCRRVQNATFVCEAWPKGCVTNRGKETKSSKLLG